MCIYLLTAHTIPQHGERHENRRQAIDLTNTTSSRLTNCSFGGENAGSSFELVAKVSGGPVEGMAPGRATALAPQGTLHNLLLRLIL